MTDKDMGKKAPKETDIIVLNEAQAAELNYGKGDEPEDEA